MRAFITGGTGFVGGHLAERLAAEGWEVLALARATSDTAILEAAGCRIVSGGLGDLRAAAGDLRTTDVFFHLAGMTKALDRRELRRVNGHAVGRVLDDLRAIGFHGRFLLVSSQAAAGPVPFGARPRRVEDTAAPVSEYGRSKLLGERYARRAARKHGTRVTILRPGAIYGPRERDILEVLKQIDRTGFGLAAGPDIQLQMTHVSDVVEALVLAALLERTDGNTYFVTHPERYSYSETLDLMGRALGRERVRHVRLPGFVGFAVGAAMDAASRLARRPLSPLTVDKMREATAGSWLADSSPLTRDTGWRPGFDLLPGLEDVVSWYRRHGWLPDQPNPRT